MKINEIIRALSGVFDDAWLPMIITDEKGIILYENKSCRSCLGQSILEKSFLSVFSSKEKISLDKLELDSKREKIYSQFYRRRFTKKLTMIRKEKDKLVEFDALIIKSFFKAENESYLLIRIVDISEEIKHEDHLQFIAHHDALTGLENRRSFNLRMKTANDEIQRYQRSFGLFYIDVDHFKSYNDQYGHEFGDQVLKGIAYALSHVKRKSDSVYRLGGDEFVFFADGVKSNRTLDAIANKIINQINHIPIIAKPKVAVSIGSILIKEASDNLFAKHIQFADRAAMIAKQKGGSYHEIANFQSST